MINGDIQYVADSLLIEKLFLIDAGINKQAGVADGLLGSISGSIMDWGKTHVDTDSGVTGVLSSLADIMVPGVLFKINPLLGGLGTIAEVLGFSPMSIIKKIMQFLQSKLSSGKLPSLDEINSIGKEVVGQEAGPIDKIANYNMLDDLHEIEKKGQLVRLARGETSFDTITRPDIPFFGGEGGIIGRIFGQLFKMKAKGKAKWLLGGFIVWIIKTILLGAGLIAGGEMVASLFKHENKPEINLKKSPNIDDVASYNEPSFYNSNKLTPTGNGEDTHVNDHKNSTWVVPMVAGSVENTLLAWAVDIYHGLQGKESLISSTQAFNKTVNEMSSGLDDSHSNKLTVPSKFKSRKQIVDQFISEVESKI
jgi:hypothetical protein